MGSWTTPDRCCYSHYRPELSRRYRILDLAVYGDGFEPLTLDPFSFVGQFPDQGLLKLRMELLGPARFVYPLHWSCNTAGTEFHATIQWMTWTTTKYG